MLRMNKKNWHLYVLPIIVFIWSLISFFKFLNHRNEAKKIQKSQYINRCIQSMSELSWDKDIKAEACSCGYEYLFYMYGSDIYSKNFKISKNDSIKVIECLLDALDADSAKRKMVLEKMNLIPQSPVSDTANDK